MSKNNDAFLKHEALHMSCFLMQSVDSALLEHPAIRRNPRWSALADAAHQALFDLYQAIGADSGDDASARDP